jgi:hypothetical protein
MSATDNFLPAAAIESSERLCVVIFGMSVRRSLNGFWRLPTLTEIDVQPRIMPSRSQRPDWRKAKRVCALNLQASIQGLDGQNLTIQEGYALRSRRGGIFRIR